MQAETLIFWNWNFISETQNICCIRKNGQEKDGLENEREIVSTNLTMWEGGYFQGSPIKLKEGVQKAGESSPKESCRERLQTRLWSRQTTASEEKRESLQLRAS